MASEFDRLVMQVLRDLQVGLKDEFDRNFERQGFFAEKWQRRKSPLRPGGAILVDSGDLRRSVTSRVKDGRVVFMSDHPAAPIHNEGGEIKVTERMKRYFMARHMEAKGSFGRRKDGSLRRDKRNARLGTEAEFYKAMALMPVGKSIVIPRRQFLGMAPEVERLVRDVIEDNLRQYFDDLDFTK